MTPGFDPYHKWLGISPAEQPPHHYRLLGISEFETDPDVIQSAGDRQMAHVRTYGTGPHSELSQKLLNEISAAKLCLLQPAKKRVYDEQLQIRLRRNGTPTPPPASAPPLVQPVVIGNALPPTLAPHQVSPHQISPHQISPHQPIPPQMDAGSGISRGLPPALGAPPRGSSISPAPVLPSPLPAAVPGPAAPGFNEGFAVSANGSDNGSYRPRRSAGNGLMIAGTVIGGLFGLGIGAVALYFFNQSKPPVNNNRPIVSRGTGSDSTTDRGKSGSTNGNSSSNNSSSNNGSGRNGSNSGTPTPNPRSDRTLPVPVEPWRPGTNPGGTMLPGVGATIPRPPLPVTPVGATVNLLKDLVPEPNSINGKWHMEYSALISPASGVSVLSFPFETGSSYRVNLVVERRKGTLEFAVGLPCNGTVVQAVLDANSQKNGGLQVINGRAHHENPTTYRRTVIHQHRHAQIQIDVQPTNITLTANGEKLIDWRGDVAREFTQPQSFWPRMPRPMLYLGSWDSEFRITTFTYTPLSPATSSGSPSSGSLGNATPLLGGTGGFPFQNAQKDPAAALVGVRVNFTNFAGKSLLGGILGIFQTPTGRIYSPVSGAPGTNTTEVLAKPGYAVGGLIVKSSIFVHQIKVVFMKADGDELDPLDQYSSSWLGPTADGVEANLLSKGPPIIGFHGRAGLGIDAIGLIFRGKENATGPGPGTLAGPVTGPGPTPDPGPGTLPNGPSSPYGPPPTNGLVAHWTLDRIISDDARDSLSGETATGTEIVSAAGKAGGGAFFPSQKSWFDLPEREFGPQFTLSFWIRPSAVTDLSTIAASRGSESQRPGFALAINTPKTRDGVLSFVARDLQDRVGGLVSNPGIIAWDAWQHVVAVVDTKNSRVMLMHNGNPLACKVLGPISFPTKSAWRIGAMLTSDFGFRGAMDEIRVYNRMLDIQEIRALTFAYGPVSPTPSGPGSGPDPGPSTPLVPPNTAVVATPNPPTGAQNMPARTLADLLKGETRRPVPELAAREKAKGLVDEIFADEMAKAKSPAEKATLARKLTDQARQTTDDAAAQYTMLRQAADMASSAGQAVLAWQALDELGLLFEEDVLPAKRATLEGAAKHAKTPEDYKGMAEMWRLLLNDAIRRDDFPLALNFAEEARVASRKFPDDIYQKLVLEGTKELKEMQAAFLMASPHRAALERDSQNAVSALGWGRFVAAYKGDWRRGLPFWAAGTGPTAETAKLDLSDPTSPESQLKVADGWWDAAEKEREKLPQKFIRGRAAEWYTKALPGTSGLVRARVQKRIEEFEQFQAAAIFPAGQWVNVLGTIDVGRHKVRGDWGRRGEEIGILSADPDSRIALPVGVSESYEIQFSFIRGKGSDGVGMIIPVGDRQVLCILGSHGNRYCGFETINGEWLDRDNPSRQPLALTNGRRYTGKISVKKEGDNAKLAVDLDGRRVTQWEGPISALNLFPSWSLPSSQSFALIARWNVSVAYDEVKLKVTDGAARLLSN